VTRRVLAAAGAAAAIAALTPGVAGAATRNVFVGGDGVVRTAPAQFSPNAFLRKTITVHVGDTVRWRFRGFHTVTVPVKGKEPPAFTIPTGQPVTGAIDAAGRPFWFNGILPALAPNPLAAAPTKGSTYDGKKLRNSGVPALPTPKPYSLRFTKAGTFDYYCAVHPGMEGKVKVVSARRKVPTDAQNQAAGTSELARIVRHATAAAALPPKGPTIVDVGRAPAGERFTIDAFFPANPTVKVGQPLQFTMQGQNLTEIHTITFGPQTRDQLPFINAAGVNPVAAYRSEPPPAPLIVTGTNHGNGFLNAGLHDNDPATPPLPNTDTVVFSKAGTYQLKCIVHDGMDATVTVTP
jgi:plastocyanin